MNMDIFWGLFIPFLGTSLGAACVFFMRGEMHRGVQRGLTGFASGVMVAASIWSLLIPALEESSSLGKLAFIPSVIGFGFGMAFLLLLDHVIPHLHMGATESEGPRSHLARTTMLVLAVTLHNIPEGMAVGVVLAGFLSGHEGITFAAAMALSLGIAIQNFPEGAIISMPLRGAGMGKMKAFVGGVLSGGGGTDWRVYHHSPDVPHCASHALSPVLCSGSHDVRGGGGTDPGNVGRRALGYRSDFFCLRIRGHDDPGRGTWISEE